MKPYYERDGVVLYLGDCAEIDIECGLIVTDPPYGDDFKSGRSDNWTSIAGDNNTPAIEERLLHVLRGLPRSRHIYFFGKNFDASRLPLCGVTELIWDKAIIGMGDLTLPWGPQHEKITFGVYQSSKANRANGQGGLSARLRKGSVLRSLRPHSARIVNHPMEKPVDVLRQLIESSSVMGETIYDPFAGSGSTLIAAALEGRMAIGCEIEERYCEIAAKRFDRELNRLIAHD